jgi:hypothetical protein
MKIDRAVVAAALLLASAGLHAYQIIEGRYRVEVSPGTYEDQLVVRCDDGRTLTVRWETKLAEACGEGLMGGPAPKAARTPPANSTPKAAQSPQAEPVAKTVPEPTAAGKARSGLFDEQSQKEAMLAQVRAQFGNVPERYVEFKPGADGLSMRFLPPLSDILKKYEMCRKAREARADCAADREGAIAKLSDTPPPAAARNDKPAAPAAKAAAAAETSTPPSRSAEIRPVAVQPDAGVPAAVAPDRAAAQQKIGEDYARCMRAKPKFECEQERAKALGALDKPKPVAKPKRPGKQAATAPNVATAK